MVQHLQRRKRKEEENKNQDQHLQIIIKSHSIVNWIQSLQEEKRLKKARRSPERRIAQSRTRRPWERVSNEIFIKTEN